VDVSSSDRFDQLSPTYPTAPISDEVLSPTNNNVFAGSHPRIHKMNAPGGRNPGEGKYGEENFKFCAEFVFASRETWKCVCSTSGLRGGCA
jgi:hypothetical protein